MRLRFFRKILDLQGLGRHGIFFGKPTPQINLPAASTAERRRLSVGRGESFLAGGTTHGDQSFFFLPVEGLLSLLELESELLLSDFGSLGLLSLDFASLDLDSPPDLSALAAFR